jgi:hypothetical protein
MSRIEIGSQFRLSEEKVGADRRGNRLNGMFPLRYEAIEKNCLAATFCGRVSCNADGRDESR